MDPRREFGHYESDTAVGSAPSRRCIDTQVERKSRRLFARFIPDKGAPATARAGRSHRIRGRGCSGPGHRMRARHAPGLHDPVDAAARHDDALMFQGGLDPPGPVHPAAVAPHASHILLMGVGPFGLGVVEHPVVCRLRHAQDPALRRYRAAAGIGPYHACFRANTGAACSETSTSISNCLLPSPARPARSARTCGCRRPWSSRCRGFPASTGAGWNARCRTPF